VKRTANDLHVLIQLFMSLPTCLILLFRLVATGWLARMTIATFCELIWLHFCTVHLTSIIRTNSGLEGFSNNLAETDTADA
jgi:hypothetical protein